MSEEINTTARGHGQAEEISGLVVAHSCIGIHPMALPDAVCTDSGFSLLNRVSFLP